MTTPTRVTIHCQSIAGFPAEMRDLVVGRCCPKCQCPARVVLGIPDDDRRYVPVRCGLCETVYALPASSALLPATTADGALIQPRIEEGGRLAVRVTELGPSHPLRSTAPRPEPLRVPVEASPTPVRELPATTHVAFGRMDPDLARQVASAPGRVVRYTPPQRRLTWRQRLRALFWGWV